MKIRQLHKRHYERFNKDGTIRLYDDAKRKGMIYGSTRR